MGAAAVVLAAVAAAVVSTAAAVVLTAVAEDQCQPLVGSLLGSGGDWIFVDTVNILATFCYYLASFLASVYLLVSQKETNVWPSIRATNK